MSNYSFDLRWSIEDSAYIAVCPEFPGVSAVGETAADALCEIQVALGLALEACREEGWPVPTPRYVEQFRSGGIP